MTSYKIYQTHGNPCVYYFENQKDLDNFHANLMNHIDAVEISINKDPLI
jgi:hypothetical protein